ncbi:hypothetical protein PO878_09950 [Iamia majanohamensis]|uniref:Uncharacterized protein n=1 Tax=Iamia majanohamensis TaxID=467976 RepID=A0AAE9YD72_9ACTN|nr:hypothetical protein [Iamia majanohamensis]WCO69048.1 hypothetical protein PO878_09950 [Iamia majanohamensis]
MSTFPRGWAIGAALVVLAALAAYGALQVAHWYRCDLSGPCGQEISAADLGPGRVESRLGWSDDVQGVRQVDVELRNLLGDRRLVQWPRLAVRTPTGTVAPCVLQDSAPTKELLGARWASAVRCPLPAGTEGRIVVTYDEDLVGAVDVG